MYDKKNVKEMSKAYGTVLSTILSRKSIGLSPILFIILLLLKAEVIPSAVVGWSWWWVTSPLWIPAVLMLSPVVIFVSVFVCIAILALLWFGLGFLFLCPSSIIRRFKRNRRERILPKEVNVTWRTDKKFKERNKK